MTNLLTILSAILWLSFTYGCGTDRDNDAGVFVISDTMAVVDDDAEPSDFANVGDPPEPVSNGEPPGSVSNGETTGVSEVDMSILDTPPLDAAVEPSCDDFPATHMYKQTAERYSDYEEQDMCAYQGKVLLIANTAALCGLTPQYEGLQTLQERYAARGLVVLGFLSNDFGSQEGSTEQVEMCNDEYRISFEQFTSVGVLPYSMQGQHPIFEWLTSQPGMNGVVDWNFAKFLVSADGELLARWSSIVLPESPAITRSVEAALVELERK